MEKALTRIEEKIDLLIREVITLKKRLDSLSHQPRDKPIPISTAAEYLNLSVSRLYGLIYSGELTPIQRSKRGRILFSQDELNRYLNNK
jgi:excisionase family DNA binding protein